MGHDDSDRPTIADRRREEAVPTAPAARFQPVREIARGGMGRVVEAFDVELRRTVAVKQALDAHPDARRRFEREIEITARLEHPSIVPLYDAGHAPDGTPYYVMRKLAGASLDQVIAEATTLDARLVALPNLLAVADAVAHAHGRGVIHRDLKPSNVLVGDLGETVVIDWGLAKLVGEPDDPAGTDLSPRSSLRTAAGTIFGTPGFMAPEQIAADPVDARADVYALGACLYYVLAGEPPLHGDQADVLAKTVAGTVPPLASRVAGVPPDLVTIVETAMARDPAARYLDAGGLSEDLRRFLAGQLVASHHYSWRQRLARWLRRHRRLVIAAAVVGVVGLGLGIASLRAIFAARASAEAALARERARAEDLVVAQASGYLDENPTLAVATLQQLSPASPRWAALGGMIAEARSRGIALGYPGHGDGMTRLALAPRAGDPRLLTAGNGVVWLDDLERHTARVLLASQSALLHAEWCGERIVISERKGTTIIDPRTGAREELRWPHELVENSSAGDVLVFVDDTGTLAALDLTGFPLPAAIAVPVAAKATGVTASPSGAWLLVATADDKTLVMRRTGRVGWTAAQEVAGKSYLPVFDRAEQRAALPYELDRHYGVVALDLATAAEQRWADHPVLGVGFAGEDLYGLTTGTGETLRFEAGGNVSVRGRFETYAGSSLGAVEPWFIVLEAPRRIALAAGGTRLEIRPPVEVQQIAVHDHWLVAASSAAVLAWDLRAILPARDEVPSAERLTAIAPARLLALADTPDGPALDEIALADHVTSRVFARHAIGAVIALGDSAFAFTTPLVPDLELFDRDRRLAAPGLSAAAVRDDHTLVTGTRGGDLALFDRATHASTPLAHLPANIAQIATAGDVVVAQATDGTLWRGDARTRSRGILGALVGTTAYLGDGRSVLAWDTGEPRKIATLPQPIAHLHAIPGGHLAIETADHGVTVLDPATGSLHAVLPPCLEVTFALGGERVACRLLDRVLVVELAAGETWSVAAQLATLPGGVALSPDGRTLVIGERSAGRDHLLRFDLGGPGEPAAWVTGATNALPPHSARAPIEWRPLGEALR